jgi:uncharacterized protein (TIGR02001 family)
VQARRSHGLGVFVAILTLCLAAPARAQITAGASLESDYRFRGISLSGERPVLTLSLGYDHASGLYVGGSAVLEDTPHDGVQLLGQAAYLGYATPKGLGPSWDVGVSHQTFTQYPRAEYAGAQYTLRYTEAYVGVITDHISAHLYYSPSYLRPGASTVYADLSGAVRPAQQWRLFGHVGALTPLNQFGGQAPRRERYDLRVGVARQFAGGELHLAWTTTSPGPPVQLSQNGSALVLGAAYFF